MEILAEDNIEERLGIISRELNTTFGTNWDDARAARRRLLTGPREEERRAKKQEAVRALPEEFKTGPFAVD